MRARVCAHGVKFVPTKFKLKIVSLFSTSCGSASPSALVLESGYCTYVKFSVATYELLTP